MILTRFAYLDDRTIGELDYNNEIYWTIENPWLGNQRNLSCIPEGTYEMERYDSPTHGAKTWQLVNVPDRTYIQIHAANYARDVLGCIGLGVGLMPDLAGVSRSRDAMRDFHKQSTGMDKETITVTSRTLGKLYEY